MSTETTYKHYASPFTDREGGRWALVITYPDVPATAAYPAVSIVTLGDPPVMLTIDRDDALSPIALGRLSFSLLEEKHERNYRHLIHAPEGSVSVQLLRLPEGVIAQTPEEASRLIAQLYADSEGWEKGFWRGTLDPESYREPADRLTGYLVQFEASDFGHLKRIDMRRGDKRLSAILPRQRLRDLIASLLSLGLADSILQEIATRPSGGKSPALTASLLCTWCAAHFSDTGDDLWVDTEQFISAPDEDKPLSAYEVLERLLRPLSLTLEQAGGLYIITDLSTLAKADGNNLVFSALNPDGLLELTPTELVPRGADGELSALPARGALTLTSSAHLEDGIPAFPLPPVDDFHTRWHLVPRADTVTKLPAWRYLPEDVTALSSPSDPIRIETEEISTGEDRRLYALIWAPRNPHALLDGPALTQRQHGGWTLLRTDVIGWEWVYDRYINRGLVAVSESGETAQLSLQDTQSPIRSALISSFAESGVIPEAELSQEIGRLIELRDRLNSDFSNSGDPLFSGDGWRIEVPRVKGETSLGLRLDLPLMVSMGQDFFQELDEKTFVPLYSFSYNSGGRSYDRYDRRREASPSLEYFRKFTDSLVGVQLNFSLTAHPADASSPKRHLRLAGRALIWTTDPNEGLRPHLFYGSRDEEDRLKWGTAWNHPNIGAEDYLGEGLHIPYPEDFVGTLELVIYSDPHFWRLQEGNAQHFQGWRLWSVPSIVAVGAPSIWIADRLGRKGDSLAPEYKLRYRYAGATDETQEEELHLSDGEGLPATSPAILRDRDGVALSALSRPSPDSYRSTSLMGYRAECFGALYGALPERGFELAGTFRFRPDIARAQYMGLDWVTVSREIDIQALTERGTYHLLRPVEVVRREQLAPQVLTKHQSRGETYDTTSPRYMDYARPRPPRRR